MALLFLQAMARCLLLAQQVAFVCGTSLAVVSCCGSHCLIWNASVLHLHR
jgi:hypothetical protein